MSNALKKWLVMNLTSYTIFVYVGIYINLFIWEKNRSIFDVAWFNLLVYLAWSFAFTTAGYLLSKHSIRLLLGISALSGASAFALLSFVELDSRLAGIALIGVPVGLMYGFFSAAQNLSVSLSGTAQELGRYFSTAGSIQQVVTLAVPLLSAAIIQYFGYSSTFALMLVFLAFMLVFSFAMPRISLQGHVEGGERSYVSQLLRDHIYSKKSIRWLAVSTLAAGVFLQFQQLFLLVFTFSVTENKFWIAGLNGLYTLATLAGLVVYRKLAIRESVLLVIGCALLASGFLVVLIPGKAILIVSNLMTAVGMFYFGAAWNTHQFKLIKPYSQAAQAKLLIWRESLICVTRIATLLVVMTVDDIRGGVFVGLIVISLLCLLAVPYCEYRARKALDRDGQTVAAGASAMP